jgi:hypothetical protein
MHKQKSDVATRETTPRSDKKSWHKPHIPAPLRHGATLFIIAILVEYLVIPKLAIAGKHLNSLSRINPFWIIAGFLLEGASLWAYAILSRSLLPTNPPKLFTIFRIDLAGNAIAHIVPGGTAGSAGLGFRLLTSRGVPKQDAAFAIATQGIGSAVVLNILLWISIFISIPIAGLHSAYESIALLIGLIALLMIGILVFALVKGETVTTRILQAIFRPIPKITEEQVKRFVLKVRSSLRHLGGDRDRLKSAIFWAALNWLFDAASLWAFLASFGHFVLPFELFVAYGVANVMAVIPITPGGLLIVESVSSGLLASFGVPYSIALLAVLGWRFVNYWLPIPLGTVAYISLRVEKGSRMRSGRKVIQEMAQEAHVTNPEG